MKVLTEGYKFAAPAYKDYNITLLYINGSPSSRSLKAVLIFSINFQLPTSIQYIQAPITWAWRICIVELDQRIESLLVQNWNYGT